MSDNNEEPKIIVDEDWKSQVAREKEEAKNAPATPDEETADGQAEQMGNFPPPNILVFISMLASQAMTALGVMADPMSGEVHMNRPLAKHFIDMLGVLQEKTKGNLTEDESSQMRDALHQLRMFYVQTENMASTPSPEPNEPPPSSIELP